MDGVRHPEGHEAVAAVAVEVVDVMEEAEGDPGLEDSGGAERLVEATELGFSAWMGRVRMLMQKEMSNKSNNNKPTVINLHPAVQGGLLKGNHDC